MNGYDKAQAQYDAMEPDADPPACPMAACDNDARPCHDLPSYCGQCQAKVDALQRYEDGVPEVDDALDFGAFIRETYPDYGHEGEADDLDMLAVFPMRDLNGNACDTRSTTLEGAASYHAYHAERRPGRPWRRSGLPVGVWRGFCACSDPCCPCGGSKSGAP